MAAVAGLSSASVPNTFSTDPMKLEDTDASQNVWGSILSEVQSGSSNKLPSCKVLLVLGDNESGKTTLIARLQGNEDPKKGSGLEYHYIDVRDEYRDDHTRLSAWVLDGDTSHSHLLKFTLPEKIFQHTTVLLCASMTQPWNVMDTLQTWATILQNHIDRLKIPLDEMKEHQQRAVKRWQDYVEPGDDFENGTSQLRRTTSMMNSMSSSAEEQNVALPLGENTLVRNLGLELIVVITKTDYMSNLEKEYDYKDEHFDFIQQSVRKFCLQYGASLFYTSVKEDKNCDLLSKYLVHRIYGFPFHTPALVVEKDAVFIPAGWDNDKKISILYENMTMKPEEFYSDVIVKPAIRKTIMRDSEIQAEEEQVFLLKQQSMLNQQLPIQGGSQRQESPIRGASVGVQKTPDRRVTGSPGVQVPIGSPKKVDTPKAAGTNEGVLANFFNSLLNKKTGAGFPPAGGGGTLQTPPKSNSNVRSDAAAELDRMTRPKKLVPNQSPHSPNSNAS